MTMEELRHNMDIKMNKRKSIAKARDKKRLRDKTVNKAEQIHTSLHFRELSISTTGWMGRRFDDYDNAKMKKMWRDRSIESEMRTFQRVPFNLK